MDCTGCKWKKSCGLEYPEYDVECPEYQPKAKKKKRFPDDCKYCGNLIKFDMSVDDITNICTVNGMQIDDCDIDFKMPMYCPLE